jgi:hypothetical protein
MQVSKIDFYTGFEDEPELVFVQKTEVYEKRLMLWEGYFDTIMIQKANLSSAGEWIGLAYYYHLCLGCWGDDQENWQIPNIEEVLNQLKKIQFLEEDAQIITVLNALISFLVEASNNNSSVFITRF